MTSKEIYDKVVDSFEKEFSIRGEDYYSRFNFWIDYEGYVVIEFIKDTYDSIKEINNLISKSNEYCIFFHTEKGRTYRFYIVPISWLV